MNNIVNLNTGLFSNVISIHAVAYNNESNCSVAVDGVNAISKLVFLKTRYANKKAATLVANGPKGKL